MKNVFVTLIGIGFLATSAMAFDRTEDGSIDRAEGTSISVKLDTNAIAVIQGEAARVLYDSLLIPTVAVGGDDTAQEFHKKGKNMSCAKSAIGTYRCSFKVLHDGTTVGFL